jgi:hypothetical protein
LLRRSCLLAFTLLCAFAAAAPALAFPHLSKSQTREVSTLVNRFVNDVVRRQNLVDGWKIAGPELRGGTTRKAWVSGRGVTVEQFSTRDRNFRKAWYADWASGGEMGLTVTIRSGKGRNREMIDETMVLTKRHGQWLVNSLYPTGIIRPGRGHKGSCATAKCAVTGIYDFAPSSGGATGSATSHVAGHWLIVVFVGIAAAPIALVVGAVMFTRRRNRRARAAYLASRSS